MFIFIFSQFVDPMSGAKAYYPVMPTTQYVQTMPQVSYVQAAPQQVSYTPTTYAADPMFFNFGRYFNNNIGGKVLFFKLYMPYQEEYSKIMSIM